MGWKVKSYYTESNAPRSWGDLDVGARNRFISLMAYNENLLFWPKTNQEWEDKNGVKFLKDGTGYILKVSSLRREESAQVISMQTMRAAKPSRKRKVRQVKQKPALISG